VEGFGLNRVKFGVMLARAIAIRMAEVAVDAEGRPMATYANLTPMKCLDFDVVKDIAMECEQLGYDSIWIPDHLIMGASRFECWTTLTALSMVTHRIKLGTSVLANSYRHPPLVAKMAATFDHISNGRFIFGIGAGYEKMEYLAYGYPFPDANTRIEQLDEALEIIRRMWIEDAPSYEGKYYRIREAICSPKPIQKPHPPILVGGAGRKLLRVAAKHADIVNIDVRHPTVERIKDRLKILEEHCYEIGRDFYEIEKGLQVWFWVYANKKELEEKACALYGVDPETMIMGTPEECREKLEKFVDIGATSFILRMEDLPSKRGIRLFADKVMPCFR
jgi:probable F420-dependent oxidoreductase